MSIPTEPVAAPDVVRRLAGADRVVPVWANELGGLTFRLDPVSDAVPVSEANGTRRARYVKWRLLSAAHPGEADLADEAARLAWAASYTPVPRVLEHGRDDDSEWLVTEAIDARTAVDPRWIAAPQTAVRAIGVALRALHDALPVADCPFTWSVEERVARVLPEKADPGTLARLADAPDLVGPVVCHGDACAPNTLLHDDGTWAAHVDLGRLGVADPWADLSVAALSTVWNYGPGYEHLVYESYGIDPDPDRIAYYRLLWDAT
ncbi:phosphotransferase [Myceligenerans pegani]|uniref:Aminoglycoside 3'-phosphotransferase n=1 Tax=Myceligenerans pegani TaxID=2776917 RepID=A0ABR9N304_9MICO|nr:aminoglycoside 3'-phosphotransferase [Myceligenerans sp. TRM 65318]MBE1878024.1 aminoglycoside 3'-phosphotransferase [Myceligenerans sp. TRM 65318]MBE3020295.1 aminoglycoside 3'-phosphotransferase [Myceligenerans sp. TRM 65318]